MRTSLVLTVVSVDEPGVVGAIAAAVADHGANWEESRMARLAGRFAGILRVTIDEAEAAGLAEAIRGLAVPELEVVFAGAVPGEGVQGMRSLVLDLVGSDRPGIVKEIAGALAGRGVNVVELHTQVDSAPMSGGALFKARASLQAPADLETDALRGVLEAIADDLMVDVALGETA